MIAVFTLPKTLQFFNMASLLQFYSSPLNTPHLCHSKKTENRQRQRCASRSHPVSQAWPCGGCLGDPHRWRGAHQHQGATPRGAQGATAWPWRQRRWVFGASIWGRFGGSLGAYFFLGFLCRIEERKEFGSEATDSQRSPATYGNNTLEH